MVFNSRDVEKVERLAWILGRCHEVVNKIEQLHSMKEQSQAMLDLAHRVTNQMDQTRDMWRERGQMV